MASETTPLIPPHQPSSPTMDIPPPPPPAPDAPPSTVAEWFKTILTTQHDISEHEAASIVSNWKLGRGEEMRYYDLATYRELFGPEAGNILFVHARRGLLIGGEGVGGEGRGFGFAGAGMRGEGERRLDVFGMAPGLVLIKGFPVLSLSLGIAAYFEPSPATASIELCISAIFMFLFVGGYCIFYFGV